MALSSWPANQRESDKAAASTQSWSFWSSVVRLEEQQERARQWRPHSGTERQEEQVEVKTFSHLSRPPEMLGPMNSRCLRIRAWMTIWTAPAPPWNAHTTQNMNRNTFGDGFVLMQFFFSRERFPQSSVVTGVTSDLVHLQSVGQRRAGLSEPEDRPSPVVAEDVEVSSKQDVPHALHTHTHTDPPE